MVAVYISPTEHDQSPQLIHGKMKEKRSNMAPQEPQEILNRDRLPR